MSDEKPISPFKPDFFGRAPVTEKITYSVTDAYGDKYLINEVFDISLNGNTGLTKEILVRSRDGDKQNIFADNYSDILELVQNSPERNTKYKNMIQKVVSKSRENDKGVEFNDSLQANGTYNAAYGVGYESINDIPILSENTRNDIAITNQAAEDLLRLENYRKSVQVKNEALAYPPHLKDNKGEDYIFIEQFEYSPPQPDGTTPLVNEQGQSILKTGVGRTKNIEESRGSCRLPIPNKLGVSNGVSWGEAKANAIELAAFQSAVGTIGGLLGEKKKNIVKVIQEGMSTGGAIFKDIRDDFKNKGGSEANSASVISAVLARSALSQIGINVDVDQFITRQTGAAINPNLELLFGGPQLRTFSFNFNFAPESPEEAVEVRKIQRWFKQGMLPTRSTVALDSTLFLGSPNVFRIQYRNQSRRIKGLNLIKICALTSCQIDFTPDGTYQSYSDSGAVSMPVRSTMGLTFNELTPVFKDDYIGKSNDPSLSDLGSMLEGDNALTDNDVGF